MCSGLSSSMLNGPFPDGCLDGTLLQNRVITNDLYPQIYAHWRHIKISGTPIMKSTLILTSLERPELQPNLVSGRFCNHLEIHDGFDYPYACLLDHEGKLPFEFGFNHLLKFRCLCFWALLILFSRTSLHCRDTCPSNPNLQETRSTFSLWTLPNFWRMWNRWRLFLWTCSFVLDSNRRPRGCRFKKQSLSSFPSPWKCLWSRF